MTIISPSILSCDFTNIETELSHFKGEKNLWVHLDIMDGHFVPNLTFGAPVCKKISKITELPLDAHLMVSNPEFHIDQFKGFGIHNITFHIEATEKPLELIKEAKKHFPSVGISIKPKTDLSVLTDEILSLVDLVLVMSVEPGFGGQSFIETTWNRISELNKKKESFNFTIQVDGGVKDNNSKSLIEHGCDNLVAGSYVFNNPTSEYVNKVNSLRN